MEKGRTAVLARVTGRVQGVNFRAWTQSRARRLGLAGWVRNEPDGSVTALIVGPDPGVSALIEALWQGPPAASVTNVALETPESAEDHAGFRITG